ncbi:Smr/MutS family protein [Pokkaliibacter sp. CJK22405]|uniref:Smr/MutS family protein n=1 Tax=Pokkaliibacter sp. CJK22405 TaxID=3384615 RepID=UPI003984A149
MSEDDFDVFRSEMKGVRRLNVTRRVATKPVRQSSAGYRRIAASEETVQTPSDLTDAHMELVGSETPLLFCANGVQINLFRKLRQGRIPWEAGLDLHGMSIEDAREELHRFIQEALHSGMKSVIVVHGKAVSELGKYPLLKSHTNDWLRQIPAVLAFSSAQPKDGGHGAVYVLLKSRFR